MLPTLFTTTLFFAIFALRVRADFFVATVSLTQVGDSPKRSPFPTSSRLFRLLLFPVQTRDLHMGWSQWSL